MKKLVKESLNEIIGQRKEQYGYNKEKRDIGIIEVEKFVIDKLTQSPITFTHTFTKEGFDVSGPFNTYIHIGFEPHREATLGIKEKSATYFVRTNIESWESPTARELLKKLKSSVEFKQFIKGSSIDKIRKIKLDKIIKAGWSHENFLAYIKYMSPKIQNDKEDRSGPYATTGTNINTYYFDFEDLFEKWSISIDESDELIDSYKQAIIETRGFKGGYLTSVKIPKWEYNTSNSVLTIQVASTTYYN
jgi:hypothetical protein